MEGRIFILTKEEMLKIITTAVEIGVNRVLEKRGIVSPFLTRKEIIKMVGRNNYDNAVRNGQLIPQKNKGKNSKIFVPRSQFDDYILKNKT